MTTKMRRYLPVAAVMAAFAMPPPAMAAVVCGPHEKIVKYLDRTHKERREAIGLTLTGQLLEVYISDTGSWTIVQSSPEGKACIVSAGEGWEGRLAEAPGTGV